MTALDVGLGQGPEIALAPGELDLDQITGVEGAAEALLGAPRGAGEHPLARAPFFRPH